MPAKRVRVKAVPGRVVRESPRGDFIPSDRYVQVDLTPYVQRLISFHGDLLVEEPKTETKAAPPVKPAPAADKEKS